MNQGTQSKIVSSEYVEQMHHDIAAWKHGYEVGFKTGRAERSANKRENCGDND